MLSLGGISNSSSFGGSSGFSRGDRFGFGGGRQNAGKVNKRDDFKKSDFKVRIFPVIAKSISGATSSFMAVKCESLSFIDIAVFAVCIRIKIYSPCYFD